MPLKAADIAADQYAKDLEKVLVDLEKRLVSVLRSTQITGTELFDATAILNARPIMLQELRNAGYTDIANQFVGEYPAIVDGVNSSFVTAGIQIDRFSQVDAQTFQQIAKADLEAFRVIGDKAMDDLRIGMYKLSVQGNSFEPLVDLIRASTVGTAKNGAPLANYARTHANTASLSFSNQVSVMQGEALEPEGADLDKKLWEVVGPLDSLTRPICLEALSEPVRTKEAWIAMGYWGVRGLYNCRHLFRPYFGDI